jgi:hypothetical protein
MAVALNEQVPRATARALRAIRGNLLPCACVTVKLVDAAEMGNTAEVCRLVEAGANMRVGWPRAVTSVIAT